MDIMTIYCMFKSVCLLAIAVPVVLDIKRDWSKSRTSKELEAV